MDNIETLIRKIVSEELDKAKLNTELVSVTEFCNRHGLNRVTLWRAEKEGRVKVVRIGTRVFLNPNQFISG